MTRKIPYQTQIVQLLVMTKLKKYKYEDATAIVLFRYMTVADNIAFGLEVQKKGRAEIRSRVDEPFAAIDAKVRRELRTWLKEMIGRVGVTSIFVTHDQEEALEVADTVIVTNLGRDRTGRHVGRGVQASADGVCGGVY